MPMTVQPFSLASCCIQLASHVPMPRQSGWTAA